MGLGNQIKLLSNATLDIIYPNNCSLCQQNLLLHEKFVCQSCSAELPYIQQLSDQKRLHQLFWGRVNIEQTFALYNYQKGNKVQDILQLIKYNNKTKLAQYLGETLGSTIESNHPIDYLIPIPLHPKKLKQRGFNQSDIIAQGIQKKLNVPIKNKWVNRMHHNPSQTSVNKYERWNNVKSIFSVKHPSKLINKHVLLIDDVLTTGATLEACAAVLNQISNCKVSVATIAARV